MSRLLLTFAAVSALCMIAIAGLPNSNPGRTLEPSELWTLYGGMVPDRCCATNDNCHPEEGTVSNCNDEPEGSCNGNTMTLELLTDDQACLDDVEDASCDPGADVDCAYKWNCVWDNGACFPTMKQTWENPITCTDSLIYCL